MAKVEQKHIDTVKEYERLEYEINHCEDLIKQVEAALEQDRQPHSTESHENSLKSVLSWHLLKAIGPELKVVFKCHRDQLVAEQSSLEI